MSALRDELLKKYGVGAKNAPASQGPTIVDNVALQAPATSGQPVQKTGGSIRDQLISKYVTEPEKKKAATTTASSTTSTKPVATTTQPVSTEKSDLQKILDRKETISAAPEKTFFQKIGDSVKKGLQSIGILKTDEEIIAKSQVVTALTNSLNDRPYLDIGKQLGLDQTVEVKYPPGVQASDFQVPGTDIYKNMAVIDAVKNNFKEIGPAFGLDKPETIDRQFVEDNFDAITKELGIRDMPTNAEFLGMMLTGTIGVGVAGSVAMGAKLLPTLAKVGGGILGFEAINKVERELNKVILGKDKSLAEIAVQEGNLGPTGEGLVYALDLFAKGKVLHSVYKASPEVAAKLTKTIVTDYKLPQTVYIEPAKIKDIFQTGQKISAEEMKLVQALGLDGAGYKQAIQNGVTIQVPAEKLVSLVDKPYWAKLKGIFGFEPTRVTTVESQGVPSQTVRGYLPEGRQTSPVAPRIVETPETIKATAEAGKAVPGATVALPAPVQEALSTPVSSKLLETISKFTPEEQSAFGRRIVERINEEVGTKIPDEAARVAGIPENIKVNEFGSADGRPAQFGSNGKIEVFLPDLVRDLRALSEGKRIVAHGGANARVYELKQGESMEQLAVRYVKDVLVHEKAHANTSTLEDNTRAQQLRNEVLQARATGDQKKIIEANTNLQKFMESLETKALEYERGNRELLENELFGKPGRRTAIQKQIDTSITGEGSPKIITTEDAALRAKLKAQEKGSKEGFQAGKNAERERITTQTANKAANEKVETKREKELALLKQRIKDRSRSEATLEETKLRYSKVLENMKNRQVTIADKRSQLIEYASAFLPFAERGKFLKAINNTITDKDFVSVLERMQKSTNLVERKTLISEISKELKDTKVRFKDKRPNVKFEYEAQKKLNRIRGLQKEFETRAKALRDGGNAQASAYELAQNAIADKIAEFQTANPDAVLPAEILSEIQELKMVGIKEMTAAELRSVLADLVSIKEQGRTLKELERFNRETAIQQVKDKTIDTVTGGLKNPKAGVGLRRTEDRPNLAEKVGDFFTLKHAGFEELLDALSKFDKGSKPYQSFISDRFSKQVRDSFGKQNVGEVEQMRQVSDLLKENYGFKTDREMYRYLNEMRERVKLDNVPMADGTQKTIEISKGEALQMYMWSKDPTLADTFAEGLNWSETTQRRVYSLLSEKDMGMADKMLGFYREYYKSINEVYSKEYGIDLPFNENYSPLHRNVETTMPENVLLAQEMKAYATAKNNSLKSRVKSNLEIKPRDAFSNLTAHVNKMEHYKAWSEAMFEMRRVFGDKEVRRTIEDYHGRKYLKEIDAFLNDFARDGVDRSKTIEWLDTLRTNTTAALLGINPNVGLKQLTGVMNYWIEIPTRQFFTGVTGFWTDPMNKAKFLYENSPVLRERFGQGYERDVKAALRTDYAKRLADKKNSLREMMFIFIRQADKLTTYQGAWSAYRYGYMEAKKLGKTEAEARAAGIKLAEDITNRVQESSQLDTLSPIQRGGSVYKALTMFQSQPSKYVRLLWNISRNWKYGRGSKAEHMRRFLVLWIVVPAIYNLVAEALKDKEYRSTPGEFATKVAFGPLTYPLIVGQMFQTMFGWIGGDNFNYNVSPITSIADDVKKGVDQMQAEDIDEAMTYFLEAAGKTTGVPTPLFMRPLRKELKDDSQESTPVSF